MRKRRLVLFAVTLLLTAAFLRAEQKPDKPLFTFVQLTDPHLIAGNSTENVRRAIQDVNLLDPEPRFAVVTGDLINGEKPVASTKLYKELFSELECPVYSVHGNHDNREAFEKLLHPVNRSFEARSYHGIVLDSVGKPAKETYGCRFSKRTVKWLKEHLEKVGKDTPLLMFAHASPFRPNSFSDDLPGDVYNYGEVLDLLEPYNVVAWFAGHAHGNYRVRREGVDYFVTGCISDERGNGNAPLGYRVVRVYKDHVETEYRTIDQFKEAASARGDWPMWRHDARRSAATSVALPSDLRLQWQREFLPPEPAFPRDIRLNFDASYQPVAAGGVVFVPSMVTDSVTALDSRTGEEKWKFYAGGPVRFAPVAWQGRVYFASDDGYLYCLDAEEGSLEWKFWAPPENRKRYRLLGNGRLISRWAVRGGPVMQDGMVYFGCGLWPSEGVYVCAVDAESGELEWRSNSLCFIKSGLVDHSARRDVGLTPTGYLAVSGDRLIVPAGRALPAIFSRDSGRMEPYSTGWGGRGGLGRGSWWVAANDDYYMTSGELYGMTPKQAEIDAPVPGNRMTPQEFATITGVPLAKVKSGMEHGQLSTVDDDGQTLVRADTQKGYLTGGAPGPENEEHVVRRHPRLQVSPANQYNMREFRRPVLTPDSMIYSVPHRDKRTMGRRLQEISHGSRVIDRGREGESYTGVEAYDMSSTPSWTLSTSQNAPEAGVRIWRTIGFDRKWSLGRDLRVHIKAGSRLYAGRRGVVVALEREGDRGKPTVEWEKEIEGTPSAMLAADRRLFVMTRQGRLYCFGPGEPAQPGRSQAAEAELRPRPGVPAAEKGTRGYCLILGLPESGVLRRIWQQSQLHAIILEPDPNKVRSARRRLDRNGLYGTRVHVICGNLSTVQPPPCMASLVISSGRQWSGLDGAGEFVKRVSSLLRPRGGTARLTLPDDREYQELQKQLPASEVSGLQIERQGGTVILRRTGAPEGSASWTHESGGPANSFSNADTAVRTDLAILWFGSSLDRVWPTWDYTHSRPPRPLVAGGRMFFLICNELHAVDIYTGLPLWQVSLPSSPKFRKFRQEHFVARRSTAENYMATSDILYVQLGNSCLMLDAATGSRMGEIDTPAALKKVQEEKLQWHEVRIWEDLLLVSMGPYLACMDRRTGDLEWKSKAERDRISFAAADGKAFSADYWMTNRRRRGEDKDRVCTIRAIDIETGKPLWESEAKLPEKPLNRSPAGWLQNSILPLSPYVSYCEEADTVLLSAEYSVLGAFRGKDGKARWGPDSAIPIPRARPPVVVSDRLVTREGFVYDVRTGKEAGKQLWPSIRACNRPIANRETVFVRDGLAMLCDPRTGQKKYFMSIRSGCTNNLIPAEGVLTAPNFSVGCACNYPVITSFAAVHMGEAAEWREESRAARRSGASLRFPHEQISN